MIGKTIDRYKIVDKLGEGGMGSVWKAEDTTLNRLVALKTLSPHLAENEEARKRFVREAQAASALNHPNITTVHDLLDFDEQHFICMEYVEGKTLRDLVEGGRLSVKKAVDIILQAAEALEAAHDKGILHRDVKSANIMVNDKGRVKVMDFGLAHLEDRSQLTHTGTTMGTLSYSSPELISGKSVNESSEIFSLGVVFYELLTGQLPFQGSSEAEIVLSIISGKQHAITEFRGDVSDQLEAVVFRMLEKNPEVRYQSCGELTNDLRAIRNELETTTVQISGAMKAVSTRPNQRRFALAGTIGIIGLAALYFFVLSPRPSESPYLAILPFTNMNQPPDEGFANAIAWEIFHRLYGVEGLQLKHMDSMVRYSGSEMSHQEIGLDLDAEYLLTASLQWFFQSDGTTVQVHPELIRVTDAATEWTDSYQVKFTDTMSLSSGFAQQIAEAVIEKIAPQPALLYERGTDSDEAWRFYLRGREYEAYKFNIERTRYALQMYERATGLDSTFTEAWLASTHLLLFAGMQHLPEAECFNQAESNLRWVMQYAPDSPAIHLAQGDWYYRVESNYDKAVEEFEYVLSQEPDNPTALAYLGYVQRRQGKWSKAEESALTALQHDPWNWEYNFFLAQIYMWIREYEEAEVYFDRAISILPDIWQQYNEKALLYLLWNGDKNRARSVLDSAPMETLATILEWRNPRQRLIIRNLPDFYLEIRDRVSRPSRYSHLINEADAAIGMDRMDLAKVYFDSLRTLEYEYLQNPDRTDYQRGAWADRIAVWYAGAGFHDEAMMIAQRAPGTFPWWGDAHIVFRFHQEIAEAYVLAGEYELAIDQLNEVLAIPAPVSVHLLDIDPIWNPLRDHPRFQALLERYY